MNHQWSDIQPKLSGLWEDAMRSLTDIDERCFNRKHQACPSCGGSDRYRFDNDRHEKGDGGAICSQCGSGDGMYWLMKLTGWEFKEAVNALGDYIGAVPQERITLAKQKLTVERDNSYSARETSERCNAIMSHAMEFPTHIYPMAEGISPEPLMVINKEKTNSKGEKEVIESRISVQIFDILEFPEAGKEPKTSVCNVALVDKIGNISFIAGKDNLHPNGRMSYGAVTVIGQNTKKAIYLVAGWADAWHVHHYTGAQVWCCWSIQNMDKVAFKFSDKCSEDKIRMAINYDFDELCEAEKNNCKVIVPLGLGKIKGSGGFERAVYDPGSLLDSYLPQ